MSTVTTPPDRSNDLIDWIEASPEEVAIEITRLRAENAKETALREKLADILSRTAIAMRGPEPELTKYSFHDLPERAAALRVLVTQRDERMKALYDAAQHVDHDGRFDDWFDENGEPK